MADTSGGAVQRGCGGIGGGEMQQGLEVIARSIFRAGLDAVRPATLLANTLHVKVIPTMTWLVWFKGEKRKEKKAMVPMSMITVLVMMTQVHRHCRCSFNRLRFPSLQWACCHPPNFPMLSLFSSLPPPLSLFWRLSGS